MGTAYGFTFSSKELLMGDEIPYFSILILQKLLNFNCNYIHIGDKIFLFYFSAPGAYTLGMYRLCVCFSATFQYYGNDFYRKQKIFLIRKDVDINEHERLSNFILRHKLKYMQRNSTFISVLHFTIAVGSSIMNITYTLK